MITIEIILTEDAGRVKIDAETKGYNTASEPEMRVGNAVRGALEALIVEGRKSLIEEEIKWEITRL